MEPNTDLSRDEQIKELEIEKLKEEVRSLKKGRWTRPLAAAVPILIILVTGYLNRDLINAKIELAETRFEIKKEAFQKDTVGFNHLRDSISHMKENLDQQFVTLDQSRVNYERQKVRFQLQSDSLSKVRQGLEREEVLLRQKKHPLDSQIEALTSLRKAFEKENQDLEGQKRQIVDSLNNTKTERDQLNSLYARQKKEIGIWLEESRKLDLKDAYLELFNDAGRAYLSADKLVQKLTRISESELISKDSIELRLLGSLNEIDEIQQDFEMDGNYSFFYDRLKSNTMDYAEDTQKHKGGRFRKAHVLFQDIQPDISILVKLIDELKLRPAAQKRIYEALEKQGD